MDSEYKLKFGKQVEKLIQKEYLTKEAMYADFAVQRTEPFQQVGSGTTAQLFRYKGNGSGVAEDYDGPFGGGERKSKTYNDTATYSFVSEDKYKVVMVGDAVTNIEVPVGVFADGDVLIINAGGNDSPLLSQGDGVSTSVMFIPEGETYNLKQSGTLIIRMLSSSSGTISGDLLPEGGTIPTEEQIVGTVVTASVSGTYNIDWAAGTVFILTMTADTTFTFSNTSVRVINIILTGAFVPTLPTMILRNGSDAYDGAIKNLIEVNYLNADNITYINENLPA